MNLRVLTSAALLILTTAVSGQFVRGGITITPLAPTPDEAVTIRVANSFGAAAFLISQSITQNGNAFMVEQNVNFGCFSPSDPTVASQFTVGPLTPGIYSVTAVINLVEGMPGCGNRTITQTTQFAVSHSSVPALEPGALLLFALALAIVAVTMLRAG